MVGSYERSIESSGSIQVRDFFGNLVTVFEWLFSMMLVRRVKNMS
jgi:hypothetical protein